MKLNQRTYPTKNEENYNHGWNHQHSRTPTYYWVDFFQSRLQRSNELPARQQIHPSNLGKSNVLAQEMELQ